MRVYKVTVTRSIEIFVAIDDDESTKEVDKTAKAVLDADDFRDAPDAIAGMVPVTRANAKNVENEYVYLSKKVKDGGVWEKWKQTDGCSNRGSNVPSRFSVKNALGSKR